MSSAIRIGHITDAHLLQASAEPRSLGESARLLYLSLLRPRIAEARIQRLRSALESARRAGFDHLVFSGDLSEEGSPAQFELLGSILADSGIPSERITLVPGNHDAYDTADGWSNALSGPLAAYAPTSVAPVGLADIMIVPVNTAVHQHWLLSHGAVGGLAAIQATIESACASSKRVVLVQHHPPLAYRFALAQRADGLRNCDDQQAIMRDGVLAVLHGHLHRTIDARTKWLSPTAPCNVFCAPAVVSAKGSPVRYYDIHGGTLTPKEVN